jgi:hypothetical protein
MFGSVKSFACGLAAMACLCLVGVLVASPQSNTVEYPNEVRVVSPDGQLTITLSATNERAGIFVSDRNTGHYASIYTEEREGATVSVGDQNSTRKNRAVHMAMNSKSDALQLPKPKSEQKVSFHLIDEEGAIAVFSGSDRITGQELNQLVLNLNYPSE